MSETTKTTTVSEIARSLGVPPSEVIEHCARLGIAASWGGAEVSSANAVVLRAEIEPTTAPREAASSAASATRDQTSDANVDAGADAAESNGGGFGFFGSKKPDREVPPSVALLTEPMAGATATAPGAGAADAAVAEPPATVPADTPRPARLDLAVKPGIISLVIAIGALVAAEIWALPAGVLGLWIVALLAGLVAVAKGRRARYRITSHPEKWSGLTASMVAVVGGILVILGIVASTFLVVREAPAKGALLGLGDTASVQNARWGYRRVLVIKRAGWHLPAFDAGTCLTTSGSGNSREREGRELSSVTCRSSHDFEVLAVYAAGEEPDAPYDATALRNDFAARCRAEFPKRPAASITIELPTASGWNKGDHDISCMFSSRVR